MMIYNISVSMSFLTLVKTNRKRQFYLSSRLLYL